MPLDGEEREILFWEKIRALIEAEDELAGKRIGWYLTFQGLLFTAFSLSLAAGRPSSATQPVSASIVSLADNMRFCLASIGVISSGAVFIAMGAGEAVLQQRIREWNDRMVRHPTLLPSPYGLRRNVRGGGIFLGVMPLTLSVAWAYFPSDQRLIIVFVVTAILTIGICMWQAWPHLRTSRWAARDWGSSRIVNRVKVAGLRIWSRLKQNRHDLAGHLQDKTKPASRE